MNENILNTVSSITGLRDETIREGMSPAEKIIERPDFLNALLTPVSEWAAGHPTFYHHIGITYPDNKSFEEATGQFGDKLIANNLVAGGVTHFRRYLRIPVEGGQDIFVEFHRAGKEGNGVRGMHLDFVTDDPQGLLDKLLESANSAADSLGAKVVTRNFGGGNNPVAKVGLQAKDDPNFEVAVMARTHWSDPKDW
ncbi:hypothetical protein A3J20_05065 [Candidatus Gottesmanbacteria bacterium RIFCSPLOWO2_02_FULL_42_29]|uniref:VOC domain-containing protein n=1 Tax=Candidatus Gottesmanbacteria bacterium RIFCSPLOWO2_01_FULL_42_22 TaxID=1798391 RepID=A0A1F6B7H4_9BACT|nr:MAG: hypothetical protein UV46_C0001G0014 [Candidatus Gottesmanbacteria bacterium GW2011_GWC2_42_8]OGG12364.1 MAG: hypothetical protein A2781_06140 [Candidatus Gottesmanbacteria bacterium RIFCSPHIGHO2_01_FULL_42_27]OGG19481.1 MAG: hypothetical protein A3E72_06855 [Candidatus Gottesmanbacteria bacterium RIFCSPHIGHO2_12_FULL_43_26]OGG32904.1 MAG: hypothetical protein A2968_06555 [Candidatus Gottesmanbacteria bacterium RIFCSPLOWO2_01_FULL_42_22]OGG33631.1 MAG: hypothetical protein A3G68_03070 [